MTLNGESLGGQQFAKPVVDLMVGVDDVSGTDALAHELGLLGYEDCGGEDGRRYFRKRGEGQHFNVQVVAYRGSFWEANLLFRDYRNSDAEAVEEYAAAKRAAASTGPMLLAYSRLKAPIMEDLLERARRSR